ncbi:MAG: histidine phosphatase family protein [Chloroflexi bacterium]|nr:histidine phosphatase family protein [Chloroflexota bacterium]
MISDAIKSSTRILLIRHGETDWNKADRFRGRSDISLNETGIQQARATASRIAALNVSAFYSSPLKRAIMTASLLAQSFNKPVLPVEELNDIDFGTWQGLSNQEAMALDKDLYTQWLHQPHLVTFPQGESLEQVKDRVSPAIHNIIDKEKEKTIVIVSHSVLCRIIVCILLGIDISHFWQITQDTCAINIFAQKNGYLAATALNDTCHLNNLKWTD